MNDYPPSACALEIPEETLSAWHDGLLEARKAQRLAAHVDTCAACQSRLTDIQAVGRTLRRQRSPNLQARVWRGLRTQMLREMESGMKGQGHTIWRVAAGVVAAALVVALFAGLLMRRVGQNSQPGGITTLTPTPTTGQSTGIPGGWTAPLGITHGILPLIVFAPSDPRIAYACIPQNGSGTTHDLRLSGSQDAGATWHTLGTPMQGGDCTLSVNPTNPRDLLLSAGIPSTNHLIRSFDGGQTWQPQQIGSWALYGMGWSGSNAYAITMRNDADLSQTALYRSISGTAFTQVDHNGTVSGISLWREGQVNLITGTGSKVIIQFNSPQGYDQLRSIISTDGGTTWKTATYTTNGLNVQPVIATGDGKVLAGLATNEPDQAALSRDGGATWQALPGGPPNMPGIDNLWVCPDGTLFAISTTFESNDNTGNRDLYRLDPGASAWRVALTMPVRTTMDGPIGTSNGVIACDANGHPTAIWAPADLTGRGDWTLISHPLTR